MEAIRVASAALASTSGPCAGSSEAMSTKLCAASNAFLNRERDLVQGGVHRVVKQQRGTRFLTRAVARELVNMNGSTTKVNGTKVEGASKLAAKTLDVPTLHLESSPALNKVIAALAAAILEMDKRKKDEKDDKDEKALETFGRGKLLENDFLYRQMFVIRSYEVGFDRTASIETLSNLFQVNFYLACTLKLEAANTVMGLDGSEASTLTYLNRCRVEPLECALNHVGMSDFVGDGMGTTHAMMRHRLIWVVTRMEIQVHRYPIWGDVVEIDTWVAGEGKNGMRRDWLVTDYNTGEILARATSTWVTMNQDTRRLSRMPDDVRSEVSPYFLDRWVMKDVPCRRIRKLGDSAEYIRSDLMPRLNDMDMNQHVNNVKYIGWALESVPQSLSVAHELTSMVLEYKRECSNSDVVQSLTSPDGLPVHSESESLLGNGALDGSPGAVSCSSGGLKPNTLEVDGYAGPLKYTHLLRLQSDGTEIVRGRTEWRLKQRYVRKQ